MSNLLENNLNENEFSKQVMKLITDNNDSKRNYWGEIASIICCERSDTYLRSVMEKVKDQYKLRK